MTDGAGFQVRPFSERPAGLSGKETIMGNKPYDPPKYGTVHKAEERLAKKPEQPVKPEEPDETED